MAGVAQREDGERSPGIPHLGQRADCFGRFRRHPLAAALLFPVPDLRNQPMITMRAAPAHSFPPAGFRSRQGFSLIEILVVVALLSVIILGLIAMFHQTQKALLSTTTQVDLLESGRAAADLVVR